MDGGGDFGQRLGWRERLASPVRFSRDGRVAILVFALLFGAGAGVSIAVPVFLPLLGALASFGIVRVLPAGFRLLGYAIAIFLLGLFWSLERVPKPEAMRFWPGESYIEVTAEIVSAEKRAERQVRLILAPESYAVSRRAGPPGYLRITVRTEMPADLVPGDTVSLKAIVGPPKGPVYPGGYDFRRHAMAQAVTGEGFAVSPIVRTKAAEGGGLMQRIDRWRAQIAADLQDLMPGQSGALAAALLVGIRGGLDQATLDAMRDAGLAHMLAISGLHMGIIAGGAFLLFEMLAAAIPGLAIRILPRKVAAVLGMLTATAYLLLSGLGVPTIRAYMMVMIGFTAILSGRRALSLRSLAIAAGVIVVIDPGAVASAGFQMSFAATAGLIAAYEAWTIWRAERRESGLWTGDDGGMATRVGGFIVASLATTMVAEASIAAVGLYHFQHLTLLGAVANLVGVPILAWVIMPLGIVTLLLMLAGLPAITAPLLDWSLDKLIELAVAAAGMPGAVIYRYMPVEAYLLFIMAFAAFVVARDRRLWGVAAGLAMAGILMTGQARRPDVLIDNGGRLIARYEAERGVMQISSTRQGFRAAAWARQWGLRPGNAHEKLPGACDPAGCVWDVGLARPVVVIRDPSALAEDCPLAVIAIVERRWVRNCKGAGLVLTRQEIEDHGPLALWYGAPGEPPRLEWSRAAGHQENEGP